MEYHPELSDPDPSFSLDRIRCEIQNDKVLTPYRYMYSSMMDRAEELDKYIQYRHDLYTNQGIEFTPVGELSQEEITICGRVFTVEDGKLNPNNIYIEGSRSESSGCKMKLDITPLKSYNLFPGQIICAKGTTPNGSSFVVNSLIVYIYNNYLI